MFFFDYYVVTFTHMKNIGEDKTYLIVFFFANILSFYIICVYCKLYLDSTKNRIHNKYRNLESILELEADNPFNEAFLEEALQKRDITISVCDKCDVYKPPRAHHCSVCDCCYMKMDHHCTLLNICIGHRNYKTFLLFLFSNTVFGIGQIIIFSLELWYQERLILSKSYYIIGIIFASIPVGLCAITLTFHIFLLLRNETTIEFWAITNALDGIFPEKKAFQEGPLSLIQRPFIRDRKVLNPYNIGSIENFYQVFGRQWYKWPIPYFNGLSNGFVFPKNGLS